MTTTLILVALFAVIATFELALRASGYRSRFRLVRDESGERVVEYTVRKSDSGES